MDNFMFAFDRTMRHEGGYADDPADSGGETYKGVARNHHPTWPGWRIIDKIKATVNALDYNRIMGHDDDLQMGVRNFYKREFWESLKCNDIETYSPLIALEIFDTAVNCGKRFAIRSFQRALNMMDRATKDPLQVDGLIGGATLGRFAQYTSPNDLKVIFQLLNILQGNRYIEIVESNEKQERFLRGWILNRIAEHIDPFLTK